MKIISVFAVGVAIAAGLNYFKVPAFQQIRDAEAAGKVWCTTPSGTRTCVDATQCFPPNTKGAACG
jgi:hypothetical protein